MLPEHEEIYQTIGERIRSLRRSRKMSQELLAEKAGIDRSHMGHIEQGRRRPTLSTLKKIAIALDTTLEQLLKGL